MSKNIELELRAEILSKDFDMVLSKLKEEGKFISHTSRLSVMFFGNYSDDVIDIRVRVTDGKSEIVIKKGDLHSSDRIEVSQEISNEQFVGMVKIMSQFRFDSKVGERETWNFEFPNAIVVSLVKAGELSYLEIEKMTDEANQHDDKKELLDIAKKMDVKLVENKEQFDNFCMRLLEIGDWRFNNTEDDYIKLEGTLKNKYFKILS